MAIFNNIRQLLSTSLRLPVLLYTNGRLAAPGADEVQTPTGTISGEGPPRGMEVASERGIVQYATSPYHEHFIYFALEGDHALWIGPVNLQRSNAAQVTELILRHGLPIRQRDVLEEYYAQLPLLSEEQFYAVGQLAGQLLAGNQPLSEAFRNKRPASRPVATAGGEPASQLPLSEHAPYFLELEMTRLVTTGDLESALGIMDRINAFHRAILAKDPVRSLKNSLICNCTFLARAAINGGVAFEDAFALSDRLILRLEASQSVKELEDMEHQNLMEFVALVHSYNVYHYSKPVREVIGYINHHLAEPIHLDQLAEAVFLHPNYLSTLFKKETGRTISRYILVRRIEEAKFFLRYTDNPISDIASFFQFSSQSHFIRRFSEVEGTTPLQYRKNLARRASA